MHVSRALSGSIRPLVRGGVAACALVLLLAAAPPVSADPPPAPPAPAPVDPDPGDPVPDQVGELLPRGEARVSQAGSSTSLVGTFLLDAGECDGPSGTYFRMAQPGGSPDEGPYVENNDSPCDDSSVTPLQPGSDGGLVTGEYQPHPDPAFNGNAALADRITEPQRFFGTDFGVATNATDPQTGEDVPPPDIRVDDRGTLSGDVRSFAAAWQAQHFNQGSPKPDGSTDGTTTPVTGTYDEATGRFVVEWSSQIQGGPFNNFTGVWHLEGEFRPAAAPEQEPATTEPTPTAGPSPVADSATGPTPEAATPSPAPVAASGASGGLASTGGGGLSWPPVVLVALAVGAVALRSRLRR